MIIVVSGVSGTGKTTLGALLSSQLKIPFFDADDFHSEANKEKMANGIALTDEDRQPWLETMAGNFLHWAREGGAVLACSALKESYRKTLGSSGCENIRWIVLTAPKAVLEERLSTRKGHFFDSRLLTSQLNDLEIPDYCLEVDVQDSPEEIINNILERL